VPLRVEDGVAEGALGRSGVAVQRLGQRLQPLLRGEGDEVVAGRLGNQALAVGDDLLAGAVDQHQRHGQGGQGDDGEDGGERASVERRPDPRPLHGCSESL